MYDVVGCRKWYLCVLCAVVSLCAIWLLAAWGMAVESPGDDVHESGGAVNQWERIACQSVFSGCDAEAGGDDTWNCESSGGAVEYVTVPQPGLPMRSLCVFLCQPVFSVCGCESVCRFVLLWVVVRRPPPLSPWMEL